MQLKNSETHYGHVARLLHWTSVALVLMSVMLGAELQALAADEANRELVARHASFGLLLLAVMMMRFGWRLQNFNPVRSYTINGFQKRAAISLHWFLYALVTSQCCVGVAQLLADGLPVAVFDLMLLEASDLGNHELHERLNDVHTSFANLIYITVAIHVCAAIYHQVFGLVDEQNS